MNELLYLIPPVILSLINLIGLNIRIKSREEDKKLQSLSAGISVGYIFLFLIPEILIEPKIDANLTLILFGFVIFHVPLMFVFNNTEGKTEQSLSNLLHGIFISIYSFLVAFSLIDILRINFASGIVLMIILATHNFLSEITDHTDSENNHVDNFKKTIIVLAPLVGGLLSLLIVDTPELNSILLPITAGAVLYITLREEIPQKENGRPLYFLVGTIILLLLKVIL